MKREYRHILTNFDLSYKEAIILSDAEDLLQRMHDDITTSECVYDEDLLDVIDKALKALGECNPRLNVGLSLECKDKEDEE